MRHISIYIATSLFLSVVLSLTAFADFDSEGEAGLQRLDKYGALAITILGDPAKEVYNKLKTKPSLNSSKTSLSKTLKGIICTEQKVGDVTYECTITVDSSGVITKMTK